MQHVLNGFNKDEYVDLLKQNTCLNRHVLYMKHHNDKFSIYTASTLFRIKTIK